MLSVRFIHLSDEQGILCIHLGGEYAAYHNEYAHENLSIHTLLVLKSLERNNPFGENVQRGGINISL